MLANASIGMSAGVEANPYNTLAQQLSDKELELQDRETRLLELTKDTNAGTRASYWALASLALSIIILVLVGANFYMDWKRGKVRLTMPSLSVDLRQR
jgi:hypothetical protein